MLMLQKKTSNYIMIIVAVIIAIVLIVCGISMFNSFRGDKVAKLSVNCNGEVTTEEYNLEESFVCSLGGKEYEITIMSIDRGVVNLQANTHGLTAKKANGTINLTNKTKDFQLTKDEELELYLQATDSSQKITINWQ